MKNKYPHWPDGVLDYGQTAFIRETLKITVLNIKEVPAEFLLINESAIK